MKKLILTSALSLLSLVAFGQSQEAYIKAMSKGLQGLGTAQSVEELQEVAGQFERISANVSNQWHPHYYAALAYINMAMRAEGISTKDGYTAKAQTFIDKALEMVPNESEVVALQGYNYMAQLAADPNTRGQMLSGKSMQTFSQAIQLNGENPRAIALMAQMQFGMAQFFGNSTESACGMAKKSLQYFEKEEQGKSLNPTWGKGMAEGLIGQCGQ